MPRFGDPPWWADPGRWSQRDERVRARRLGAVAALSGWALILADAVLGDVAVGERIITIGQRQRAEVVMRSGQNHPG